MKSYLPLALTALAVIAISSISFHPNAERTYQSRTETELTSEPYSMKWARVDTRTGDFNPNARSKAMRQVKERSLHSRADKIGMQWNNLGPDNVGGRTRAIIELYGKPDTLITGSVSGGLFISYDAGATWQAHEQFANLDSSSSIISCIHQDTINMRIYVGTGCKFDDSWPGFGIYMSEDGGESFQHLTSTTPSNRFTTVGSPWLHVHRIRTNAQGHIFAATWSGLYRSLDFGETFEPVIFTGGSPSTGNFADVIAQRNGRVIASLATGAIYISETGNPETFVQVSQSGMPNSGKGRTVLSHAESNPDHIYIAITEVSSPTSQPCLNSVWHTQNGGKTWSRLLVPYDDFRPMLTGANTCQGVYDLCIGVSPINENLLFIGGVQLWRYDGNLTRVANEFGSPPITDVLPNYVHADKHYIYFSPNNPKRVFVTTDGGISKSENDGATWQGLNKGYITTQFYGIAHANDGQLMAGGTQDNGSLVVIGDNYNDPRVAYEMTGGDGFDADISQISQVVITSSQFGAVFRIDAGQRTANNFPVGVISPAGGSPFFTRVKLWENDNDLSSKDSIIFSADRTEMAIDVSNGIVKNYSSQVRPIQSAAEVIASSIEVYAGTQLLTVDPTDQTKLISSGSSQGSIAYNQDGSFQVSVSFGIAPPENSNIYVAYDQRFSANDVLFLESQNLNTGSQTLVFEHRLENDLSPGDQIMVQDPVQSLLASTGGANQAGLRMYRNVLNFNATPQPINIPGVSGIVSALEFTSDGNTCFVGTMNGQLYRISELKKLYTAEDVANLDIAVLSSAAAGIGGITGIAIDPNDDNRVVVTAGGYGSTTRVKISTTALTSLNGGFVNIHGDLPAIPVYDAEIDRNNPNIILLGTEFGIWGTQNGTESIVEWTDENDAMSYIPVYDIRQQDLSWEDAKNTGTYFVGSYGRGMWSSTTLVGIDHWAQSKDNSVAFNGVKVYPNPMQFEGTIAFESNFEGKIDVRVFDINGRLVIRNQERVGLGANTIQVNTSGLKTGTYYATLSNGETHKTAKMMVIR